MSDIGHTILVRPCLGMCYDLAFFSRPGCTCSIGHRTPDPLGVAAFVGKIETCRWVLTKLDPPLVNCYNSVVLAVMRAALSDPESPEEREALDCALLISAHQRGSEHAIGLLNEGLLISFDSVGTATSTRELTEASTFPWNEPHRRQIRLWPLYPDPHTISRFVVALYSVASHLPGFDNAAAHTQILASRILAHLSVPLPHPAVVAMMRTLMQSHPAVMRACDDFKAQLSSWPNAHGQFGFGLGWKERSTELFILLDWLPLTIPNLTSVMEGLVHKGRSRKSWDDATAHVITLCERLVEHGSSATQQRPPFHQSGVIQCTDPEVSRLVFAVLKLPDCGVSRRALSTLMRLDRLREFDFRFVAWNLIQENTGRLDLQLTCKDRWDSTPAEMDFVAEWLEGPSSPHLDTYFFELRSMFRNSGPETAVRLWGLLRRVQVESASGLNVYHPCMTEAALRCLMWCHPLAAHRVVDLERQHFQVTSRIWERVATQQPRSSRRSCSKDESWSERAQQNLRELRELASVVRCVGGVSLSRLFRIPSRAARLVLSWLL
jgi:hypothetical protein